MYLKLRELTLKNEILQTYEIYKHCMFMPTEEKFNNKVDLFLNDNSVKIFACFEQDKISGVIVVSFIEQNKIEIIGISVDVYARGKGIGSYMINQVINNYGLLSIYAETDNDAVGFYQKNGFNIMEFSETYGAETVIRYKCELTKQSNSNLSNSIRRARTSDLSSDTQRCYSTDNVRNELSAATGRQIPICLIDIRAHFYTPFGVVRLGRCRSSA